MVVGTGGSVLVVDDDDGMREAIGALLEAAGVEAAMYASAEALLASDTVAAAVCVISDLRLPAMSGFELISALRARGSRAPVIVITAHDSPSVRRQAVVCGAVAVLGKPFAGAELLAAIRKCAGAAGNGVRPGPAV